MIIRYMCLALALLALPAVAALQWEQSELSMELAVGERRATGSYRFTNAGDGPITIERIKTNCGCTTAELEKRTYAPGESGVIEASISLAEGEHQRRRLIYVFTDDRPEHPQVLTIEAKAPKILEISPRLLIWNNGEETTTKVVTVEVALDEPVTVVEALSNSNRFKVAVETVEKGKLYRIAITPTSTEAMATARITVLTDFPKDEPVTYSCYARVLRPLSEMKQ